MTTWLSLAISLMAVAIGVIVMRRMVDRRTGSAVVMEEIRREVGAILTEMNQATEQNIELIEDRVKTLREIIAQADRRLSTLRREAQRQESSAVVYSHLSRAAPGKPPLMENPGAPPPADETDQPSAKIGPSASGPAGTMDGDGGDVVTIAELPPRDRALGLYRQGIPIERIASRLGTTVSEIELIVSLGER